MKTKARIWLLAGLLAVAGAAFGVWQLAAQERDSIPYVAPEDIPKEELDNAPEAAPGQLPPLIDGRDPPAVAQSTATPDLRSAVSPEEAMSQLAEVPGVRDVLGAIAEKDVDAMIDLIDWQPTRCGSPHGATDLCPDGIATGTELPMVDVGSSVTLLVTAETLRPRIADLLAGEPLSLSFASRTTEAPYGWRTKRLENGYWLAFEGAPRSVSDSFIGDTTIPGTGLFLIVDAGSDRPVIGLTPLSEQGSAVGLAYEWSEEQDLHGHEIITFNPG